MCSSAQGGERAPSSAPAPALKVPEPAPVGWTVAPSEAPVNSRAGSKHWGVREVGQGSQLVTRRIILGGRGHYSETLEIARRHAEDSQFLQVRLLPQTENKEPYFVGTHCEGHYSSYINAA